MAVVLFMVTTAVSRTSDFPMGQFGYTQAITNTITIGASATTLVTNNIEFATYHSWQITIPAAATNGASVKVNFSLDGINWGGGFTNTYAVGGGTAFNTSTAKASFSRVSVDSTNVTVSVYYLGGH